MSLNQRQAGSVFIASLLLSSASAFAQDAAFRSALQTAALKKHNELRAKHGVPALKTSATLQAVAQAWANKLAAEGKMYHSNGKYGENIYWTSASPGAGQGTSLGNSSVQSWYSEIKSYDFGKPGFDMKTGHFTQVVWKGSTELGCGVAGGAKGTFVVCNYNPPGNFEGQFPANVSKPR
ncbi:CAP family protein [Vitiosangium sp. GDMCC 1.1324]|uniref:CAP family protein n=1 Tax=Vitiosangium sp. (strain GDMCC 1.1324) TaxID=2138576 RepID=UPI00130E70B1|nr:CAP family protein [Vitiosangium sp. GDMCC 1.1324]